MSTNFEYITKFAGTSSGSGLTSLNTPVGIDTDGRFLYIADYGNARVLKWTLHGGSYVAHNSDDITGARSVLLWHGRLFVADTDNDKILVFDQRDMSLVATTSISVDAPRCMTTDGTYLYVGEAGSTKQVSRWDRNLANAGTLALTNSPDQIWYDLTEKVLYVTDATAGKVLKFGSFSTLIGSITGLTTPLGVAAQDYYLYVATANEILVYDTANLGSVDSAGSDGTGGANISAGRNVLPHRNVILFTDTGNHRVTVWHNYNPARSVSSGDARTIGGSLFQNPVFTIGGEQERSDVTIGGTAQADLAVSIEEEEIMDNVGNVEEVRASDNSSNVEEQ